MISGFSPTAKTADYGTFPKLTVTLGVARVETASVSVSVPAHITFLSLLTGGLPAGVIYRG